MTATVPAIYTKGKLELLEVPVGIQDGRVRVILIDDVADRRDPQPIQYGKYRSGTLSTEEDFALAEWRGDDWDKRDGE